MTTKDIRAADQKEVGMSDNSELISHKVSSEPQRKRKEDDDKSIKWAVNYSIKSREMIIPTDEGIYYSLIESKA